MTNKAGSCGKAHGIRGEVAVYTSSPEFFEPGIEFQSDHGPLTVAAARPHKGHLIVVFEEIPDRNTAETLRNVELQLATTDRPDLSDDEFWVSDLIGLEVRTREDEQLGIVSGVVTADVQDRLVVDTGHSEIEVPFVPELVPEVAATHIVVDPPPGLFD